MTTPTQYFISAFSLRAVLLAAALTTATCGADKDRAIQFPDLPEFLTLACDLHQHTVFSDGSVWPNIRVQEAVRDGLDVIAITDHIEYQPHKEDIPHPDRNRPAQVAEQAAKNTDLIVLRGAEITRSMPPGHANAIFLKDANALIQETPIEAFREAKRQNCFIFWNHPHWTAQAKDGVARLTEVHKQYLEEGLLHGIEVVNESTYSDEALQIALDHNLTIMGTSDIHGLIDWDYRVAEGGHRPVTLVFAKERSADGVREGLESRRTVVWFNNTLIGRAEQLVPLIRACWEIREARYLKDTSVAEVNIYNNSDAAFILMNRSDYLLHEHADTIMLEPHATTRLSVKTGQRMDRFDLEFEVLNAVTAPSKHPTIKLSIAPSATAVE